MQIRELPAVVARVLSRRLSRLCDTLEHLTHGLRESVADAIGENLGGVVRDVVLHVLDTLMNVVTHSPAAARWNEPVIDEYDMWFERDDGEPYKPVQPSSQRMKNALAVGLQTVSWWMHRQTGLLTNCVTALVAGAAAFVAPTFAVTVLSVIGAIEQLGLFADSIRFLGPR